MTNQQIIEKAIQKIRDGSLKGEFIAKEEFKVWETKYSDEGVEITSHDMSLRELKQYLGEHI